MIDYIENGDKIISDLIRKTHNEGKTVVRVSGNYEISNVIKIPSHTTLILEDCRLRLADGVYTQVFMNENALTPDVDDCDIHIQGVGTAVIDGGNYNGLGEKTQNQNGLPPVWYNNFIIFSQVNTFSIEKIQMINMRWYAVAILECCNGTIRDIEFDGDCRRYDENGNLVHGLIRELYPSTYIKNGDGIDICSGSHDILVENITGFTEDDSVALGTLFRNGEPTPMIKNFNVKKFDVYNIIVRNIRTSCFCAPVRLLNQGGPKLYNILVDGVFDATQDDPRVNHGYCGVMVGDGEAYGSRQCTPDETYNICVKNVYSRAEIALLICGGVRNLQYENINAFDFCKVPVEFNEATIL